MGPDRPVKIRKMLSSWWFIEKIKKANIVLFPEVVNRNRMLYSGIMVKI